jgi:hypothetical protein
MSGQRLAVVLIVVGGLTFLASLGVCATVFPHAIGGQEAMPAGNTAGILILTGVVRLFFLVVGLILSLVLWFRDTRS